jgi:hypothetical protein
MIRCYIYLWPGFNNIKDNLKHQLIGTSVAWSWTMLNKNSYNLFMSILSM